jgi:acetyltransferase-like isoleucine patch superfamily enzyme
MTKSQNKIWPPCNIYPTAAIGENVSIGIFSEIGPKVSIGNNVRIGAMCFIPEGVTIMDDVWIGPHCVFTNDRFPPSPREKWELTLVMKGARVGAGVTVLPGVIIGENALVGAGSVVVKSVPPEETWAGVPAKRIEKKGGK